MSNNFESGRYLHLSGIPVSRYKAKNIAGAFGKAALGFLQLPEVLIPAAINVAIAAISPDFTSAALYALPTYAFGLGTMKSAVWTFELTDDLRSFRGDTKYFDTRPVKNATTEKDMAAAKRIRTLTGVSGFGFGALTVGWAASVPFNEVTALITGCLATTATPFLFAAHRYNKVVQKQWAITNNVSQEEKPEVSAKAKLVVS